MGLFTSWCAGGVVFFAFAAPGFADRFDADFADRSKWKSFGVEVSLDFDPFERARAARLPVNLIELEAFRATGGTPVSRLKSLIALAEAGPRGYDAYHVGASTPPPRKPTQMTLGEIERWTRNTPGQPHAIGRYQFIPSTLRSLTRRAGYGPNTRFTPKIQDRLADLLLVDAGLPAFQSGQMSRTRFMNNLAKIWAGLPNSSGKSHYHGFAGNRATISWSVYKAEMRKIFRRSSG